ncbi:rhodanese-like protein [Leptolyngbya sp. Heron Island J]|uniref:rhodanese-like domain-containing protein n=1 Tax=Leptolyngbya sp. Heron Island J TaxID=1385935 RepID=UPI0003B9EFBF|nr:rhodanese-like domain-containing protein [Leptolyngbya sp. Heron Island J]ESA33232.1 rhodanese-like protein [Leptolyngbya sp. Heron Island J]
MDNNYHQVRKLLLAICLCVQLGACSAAAQTSTRISQQELVAQLEAGTAPLILDVRTAEEYEAGHIPGAINIHFRDISKRLDEIPDRPVIIYCERGIRANIAKRTLWKAGMQSVLHLEGDISQWRQNNFPLASSDEPQEAKLFSSTQPALDGDQLAQALTKRWIISSPEAKQLIEQGATLLDTRKLALTRPQGAVYVNWKQFSPEPAVTRGKLLEQDDILTQRLQALGISQHKPVVVFANPPGGWGEDGRIVWMLRTLGHTQVAMVDGGFEALVAANVPVHSGRSQPPEQGDFVVKRNATWEIQQAQLKAQLDRDTDQKNVVVVDTREAREFAGQTPYGETRGGHVPGAVNLYFKELLDQDGRLLLPDDIRATLLELGITPDTQVVVYCTGGIRSGWLAAVLVTLDYQVQNYAGSMWEWSAGPADRYPLETL